MSLMENIAQKYKNESETDQNVIKGTIVQDSLLENYCEQK